MGFKPERVINTLFLNIFRLYAKNGLILRLEEFHDFHSNDAYRLPQPFPVLFLCMRAIYEWNGSSEYGYLKETLRRSHKS